MSFYPLDKAKEQKFRRLVYCRQNKTAKLTADAPKSSKASELLRAAMGGGYTENVATFEDVVKSDFFGSRAGFFSDGDLEEVLVWGWCDGAWNWW